MDKIEELVREGINEENKKAREAAEEVRQKTAQALKDMGLPEIAEAIQIDETSNELYFTFRGRKIFVSNHVYWIYILDSGTKKDTTVTGRGEFIKFLAELPEKPTEINPEQRVIELLRELSDLIAEY